MIINHKGPRIVEDGFFSHNRESSAPYFKLLDILNINSIFKQLKISLLARKISQNVASIPEAFQNYLVKVCDIHSYNNSYASNLNFHVSRVKGSNYGKHTFRFAITKTWEEIPTEVKTLSYHKFEREYKKFWLTPKVNNAKYRNCFT